jgi:hypothetical protein
MLVNRRTCAAFAAVALVIAASPVASSPTQAAAGPGLRGHHHSEDAQVVLDWERTSMRTVLTENPAPGPDGALYLGFTSIAMYDAVQDAERHGHASAAAAAAVAAHDVLVEYFPDSQANLDADLSASLADVPDGADKQRGIRIGERAADAMIESRERDGRNDPSIVYSKEPGPGVWQPDPGGAMLTPWLGFVDPLVSRRPIEVDGPDPITSAEYAFDYQEVKRVGGATDADRTPHQTETALFFTANALAMVPDALVRHLEENPLSLRRTARLFARMHGAMADSVVTVWRLKFEVGFWRPSQAIQGAAGDGNPATVPDSAWTPLVPNPPYSDYVSGHASLTGPAVEVIRLTLGEETPLLLRSTATGTERLYPTLSAIEFDAFHARIWSGLHFRDAMEDGYQIGHTAARRAMQRLP